MADDEFSRLFPPSVARMQWPLTFEGKNKTHIRREELRNHVPNSRQQLINSMNDYFYDGGREGNRYAENAATLLDFPLGLGHGIYDATRAAGEGRMEDAGLSLAMAIFPPPFKKVAKEVKTVIKDIFGKRAPSIPNTKPKPDSAPRKDHPDAARGNRSTQNTSTLHRPAIILPDTKIVVPAPSIIQPDTSLVMPRPSVIQRMSSPSDRVDEIEFRKTSIPGGRTTPWLAPHGPLAKAPRDSILDYPNGAIVDQNGNIRYDIEGRPLIAKLIAGRRRFGEKDAGLTGDEIRWILRELNVPVTRVPRNNLEDKVLGWYLPDWMSPGRIEIWDRLPDDQADAVLGHEFGHVVDRFLRHPRARGLKDELDRIYSEGITGQLNPLRRAHPRDSGRYSVDQYRDEKMAEAIRAQVFHPNTIKTIAPKTAALLRAGINEHPILSPLFQVNGIPVGLLLGAGAAAIMGNPSESQAGQLDTDSEPPIPETKVNLRRIAAALSEPVRRRPIPATLEMIARTLISPRARPSHGGPR